MIIIRGCNDWSYRQALIGWIATQRTRGVHAAWRKAKDRDTSYLASIRQYGNVVLGVRHQEEEHD